MRHTKAEKNIAQYHDHATGLIKDQADAEDIELSVRRCITAMEHFHKLHLELEGVQDEIDFSPDNVKRLEDMSEETRTKDE